MANQICKGMDYHKTKNGDIVSWDILLVGNGKTYVITVSTLKYRAELQMNGDTERCTPDYLMENVSDIKTVCKRLATKTIDELSPFLTEVEK
jgi:hypothetical protein